MFRFILQITIFGLQTFRQWYFDLLQRLNISITNFIHHLSKVCRLWLQYYFGCCASVVWTSLNRSRLVNNLVRTAHGIKTKIHPFFTNNRVSYSRLRSFQDRDFKIAGNFSESRCEVMVSTWSDLESPLGGRTRSEKTAIKFTGFLNSGHWVRFAGCAWGVKTIFGSCTLPLFSMGFVYFHLS